MEHTIIDCEAGEVQSLAMTSEEVAVLQRSQAEAQAAIAATEQYEQEAMQARLTAAQALVATAANPAQATALTNFIRAVGVPI